MFWSLSNIGPTEVYEDAHGRIEKIGNHDMLLPHEIMASLFKTGKMHMLVGRGSVACLRKMILHLLCVQLFVDPRHCRSTGMRNDPRNGLPIIRCWLCLGFGLPRIAIILYMIPVRATQGCEDLSKAVPLRIYGDGAEATSL